MAIITTTHCQQCGKSVEETRSVGEYSSICYKCEEENANRALLDFLAERARLPMEERLRQIETAIYELQHAPEPWDGRIG